MIDSNDHKVMENEIEEIYVDWQPILRTVYTKDDIAAIVAAIDSTPTVVKLPERL